MDKNFIECSKNIKEKQKKIEILEKKLQGLIENLNKSNNSTLSSKNNILLRNKSEDINLNSKYYHGMFNSEIGGKKSEKGIQNYKIRKINEKNLDDLDALYFFDKIEMKPKSSFSTEKNIPMLLINKGVNKYKK